MALGKLRGKLSLRLTKTPSPELPDKIRFKNKDGKTFNLTRKPYKKGRVNPRRAA